MGNFTGMPERSTSSLITRGSSVLHPLLNVLNRMKKTFMHPFISCEICLGSERSVNKECVNDLRYFDGMISSS